MPALAVGKLPPQVLERLLGKVPLTDPRVVMGPRLGEDAAVLDMGDRYLVATAALYARVGIIDPDEDDAIWRELSAPLFDDQVS